MALPPLVLKIIADSSGLKKGVAESTASVNGLKASATGASALMQAGYVAAGAAVVKFGVDSVKAFEDAQNIMAQTESVLRSTGGQANVTERDVLDLASTWQDLTGVQDDAIQSSENLLLTFRDVSNEVGKGNDIFNQAEVAILNMATALNRGAVPSADQLQKITIQLGKALNDPIAGMTALRRVGVSFSESQVATIKSLQESGDLMGAQKVILGELKAEFGGAARAAGETFAGSVAKLEAEINNLEESIGGLIAGQLLPLVSILNDIANKHLPSATDSLNVFGSAADLVSRGLGILPPQVKELTDALSNSSNEVEFSQSRIEDWAKQIVQGHLTLAQLRAQLTRTNASMASSRTTTDLVSSAVAGLTREFIATDGPASQFVADLHSQAKAAEQAADKVREHRLAILALTDSFFGILDSQQQVEDAQKRLNTLQRQGKTHTQEYKDTVVDAIGAQASLNASILQHAQDLKAAGASQDQVIGKIKNLAGQFENLDKKTLASLIRQVKALYGDLIALPEHVHTTIDISRAGAANVHAGPRQHGGPVAPFMPYLVGERGPEVFVPHTSGQVLANGAGRARSNRVILDRRHYVEQADYESRFRGF